MEAGKEAAAPADAAATPPQPAPAQPFPPPPFPPPPAPLSTRAFPTPAPAATTTAGEHGHDIHAPLMARLRRAGVNPSAFRHRGIFLWAALGLGTLALLALLPYAEPRATPFTQRLATLGALVFLFAAPALWMGLGKRAFLISGTAVMALYGVTGWTGAVLHGGDDLIFVAVLLGFAVFGLAGFNLVFVLEEVVYDAHRLLPGRFKTKAWTAFPSVVVVGLAFGLPRLEAQGGPDLGALWVASIACLALMSAWWLFSAFNDLDSGPAILRELHLFVVGILLACALADAVPFLVEAEEMIPGLVAYAALLGTWVYVSYTTLQRTHFLLRGRNAAPWVAILLAATYAIVAHAQVLSEAAGETAAVQDLFARRMQYMIAGVALGIAFYVGRSMWRGLRLIGRSRDLTPRSRAVADQAARVAEGLLVTERRVGEATLGIYRALDEVLPGSRAIRRRRPGWELDEGSHSLQPLHDDD